MRHSKSNTFNPKKAGLFEGSFFVFSGGVSITTVSICQNFQKSVKIVNIEAENLHIF